MNIISSLSTPDHTTIYPFIFRGNAKEYFRIWIVNLALTMITLGFYLPWARVRNRRYFYGNTYVDDKPFSYLADPVKLLKGYLIVFVFLVTYLATSSIAPLFSSITFAIFFLLTPFFIFSSLRFKAHNTSYANVRFRFDGRLGTSYSIHLLLWIPVILTAGILFPYQAYRAKSYIYENIALGKSKAVLFTGPGKFYQYYLAVVGIFSAAFLIFTAVISISIASGAFTKEQLPSSNGEVEAQRDVEPSPTESTATDLEQENQAGDDEEELELDLNGEEIASLALGYLLFLILAIFTKVFIKVKTTNYTLNHFQLDKISLRSELRIWRLFWIQITNFLAMFFSLGLLIPWAKIRMIRYQLNCLAVRSPGPLQEFVAAKEADLGAVGDVASDFFDIEIGF